MSSNNPIQPEEVNPIDPSLRASPSSTNEGCQSLASSSSPTFFDLLGALVFFWFLTRRRTKILKDSF